MDHLLNLHPALLSAILGRLTDRQRECVVKRVCKKLRNECEALVKTLYAKDLVLPSSCWDQYPSADAVVIKPHHSYRRLQKSIAELVTFIKQLPEKLRHLALERVLATHDGELLQLAEAIVSAPSAAHLMSLAYRQTFGGMPVTQAAVELLLARLPSLSSCELAMNAASSSSTPWAPPTIPSTLTKLHLSQLNRARTLVFDVSSIAAVTSLRDLHLAFNDAQHTTSLAQLTNLRALGFRSHANSDRGLQQLLRVCNHLPHLQQLEADLINLPLLNPSEVQLAAVTSLQLKHLALVVVQPEPQQQIVGWFAGVMPQLQALHVDMTFCASDLLAAVRGCSQLRSLHAGCVSALGVYDMQLLYATLQPQAWQVLQQALQQPEEVMQPLQPLSLEPAPLLQQQHIRSLPAITSLNLSTSTEHDHLPHAPAQSHLMAVLMAAGLLDGAGDMLLLDAAQCTALQQLHVDLQDLPSTCSGLVALASGPACSSLTAVHISNSSYWLSAAVQLLRSCSGLESLTLLPRPGSSADSVILQDQQELQAAVQQDMPRAQLLQLAQAFAASSALVQVAVYDAAVEFVQQRQQMTSEQLLAAVQQVALEAAASAQLQAVALVQEQEQQQPLASLAAALLADEPGLAAGPGGPDGQERVQQLVAQVADGLRLRQQLSALVQRSRTEYGRVWRTGLAIPAAYYSTAQEVPVPPSFSKYKLQLRYHVPL